MKLLRRLAPLGAFFFALVSVASAQTIKYMKDLPVAGAAADTDTFQVCQVASGCGSTNPLNVQTLANLTPWIRGKFSATAPLSYNASTGVFSSSAGGGTPGGSSGQVQVNSSGAFGGIAGGTSGQVLTSTGPSTAPTFQNPAGGTSSIIVGTSTVTGGTCPTGQNLYNNGGIVGCQPNGTGGGSVSITSASPNIVVTPSPLTGTGTIGSTNAINTQSGTTYTIATTDAGKTVLLTGASPTVTLLAAATAGANFGTTVICQTGCTINRSGSDTINGVTSLALTAHQAVNLQTDVTPTAAWNGIVGLASGAGGGGSGTVNNCTTPGAVAYYSATGTAVSCISSAGSTGQVLTSNGAGAAPSFQPGGGGSGSYTLVSTTCVNAGGTGGCLASGQTFISWTGLAGNNSYEVVIQGATVSSSTNVLGFQLGTSTGPTWNTTAANYHRVGTDIVQGSGGGNPVPQYYDDVCCAGLNAAGNMMTGAVASYNGIVEFYNFIPSAAAKATSRGQNSYPVNNSGERVTVQMVTTIDTSDTVPITAIRWGDVNATATISNGVFSLYKRAY